VSFRDREFADGYHNIRTIIKNEIGISSVRLDCRILRFSLEFVTYSYFDKKRELFYQCRGDGDPGVHHSTEAYTQNIL
jgi:hypothetical protein